MSYKWIITANYMRVKWGALSQYESMRLQKMQTGAWSIGHTYALPWSNFVIRAVFYFPYPVGRKVM
jgi:hypothetical protein